MKRLRLLVLSVALVATQSGCTSQLAPPAAPERWMPDVGEVSPSCAAMTTSRLPSVRRQPPAMRPSITTECADSTLVLGLMNQ